MKRSFFIILILCTLFTSLRAQNPKWFKKATKAQLTITTYDAHGPLSSGYGFFINKEGIALADYLLFKGATHAVATDSEGNSYEVKTIIGANSLYDIVCFRVKTSKPVPSLSVSNRIGVNHEHVYILPYPNREKQVCINDTIHHVDKFNEQYGYYTLGRNLEADFTNSPVVDDEGKVLGLIQRNSGKKANTNYALSAIYATTLHTSALSLNNSDLNSILIPKEIPEDQDDARTFIYMARTRCDSVNYSAYLDNYIERFPRLAESHMARAEFRIRNTNYAGAEDDFNAAISVAEDKSEVYYTFSKLLYELCLSPNYSTPYKNWDLEHALQLCNLANDINPQPLYVFQKGHTLYALKQYSEAAEIFLSLANTNLRSADIFRYAAQCQHMAGAPDSLILCLQDSAVSCFNKPYTTDAAPSLLERSNTLLALGRDREAVLDLNDYERLMSSELTAYFYYHREQIEMRCRMFQQAVDDIDRAIRMDGNESLFHAERAVVYYSIGECAEALKSSLRATELDSTFADAWRLAGICQTCLGYSDEAEKYLQKAVELGDDIARDLLNK